jgi:hypothetical protein
MDGSMDQIRSDLGSATSDEKHKYMGYDTTTFAYVFHMFML